MEEGDNQRVRPLERVQAQQIAGAGVPSEVVSRKVCRTMVTRSVFDTDGDGSRGT